MKGRCSLRPQSASSSPAITLLKDKKKSRTFMVRKNRQGEVPSWSQGVLGTFGQNVGSPASHKGPLGEGEGRRGRQGPQEGAPSWCCILGLC